MKKRVKRIVIFSSSFSFIWICLLIHSKWGRREWDVQEMRWGNSFHDQDSYYKDNVRCRWGWSAGFCIWTQRKKNINMYTTARDAIFPVILSLSRNEWGKKKTDRVVNRIWPEMQNLSNTLLTTITVSRPESEPGEKRRLNTWSKTWQRQRERERERMGMKRKKHIAQQQRMDNREKYRQDKHRLRTKRNKISLSSSQSSIFEVTTLGGLLFLHFQVSFQLYCSLFYYHSSCSLLGWKDRMKRRDFGRWLSSRPGVWPAAESNQRTAKHDRDHSFLSNEARNAMKDESVVVKEVAREEEEEEGQDWDFCGRRHDNRRKTIMKMSHEETGSLLLFFHSLLLLGLLLRPQEKEFFCRTKRMTLSEWLLQTHKSLSHTEKMLFFKKRGGMKTQRAMRVKTGRNQSKGKRHTRRRQEVLRNQENEEEEEVEGQILQPCYSREAKKGIRHTSVSLPLLSPSSLMLPNFPSR